MSKNNMFIKANCDSCGAPLKKSTTNEFYVCPYCGAQYFVDNPKVEKNLINIQPPPAFISDEYSAPKMPLDSSFSTHSKKPPSLVWIVLGGGLLFLLLLSIISNINKPSNSATLKSEESSDKPVMLTSLPNSAEVGSAIAFGNWEITINPEIEVVDKSIYLSLILKNWSENEMSLTYKPNDLVVYDDLGNTYPPNTNGCAIDIGYLQRSITAKSYQSVKIDSTDYWCNIEDNLPTFTGLIPQNAKHIYIYLKDFGVFNKIIFVYDL